MKKFVNTSVGILGGVAFLWAALAIFVWCGGKLRQARGSRDWPQVEGRVTHSSIDNSRRESMPHVVYTYTVAGTTYTSNQISFDLFDNPGGKGRIESIISRYPVGQQVTIYYDPNDPGTAILEPEDYSPFFKPLFFGALFFVGGSWILWKTIREIVGGRAVPRRGTTPNRRIVATAAMSVTIYILLVLVSFDSAVRETAVKAFGERPAGLPNILFVLGLQTLLYLPMPWVFWHGMQLTFQAMQDGKRIGIGYLLTAGRSHPQLRRSRMVCIGGLVYFVLVCGAWILYTAARGV